MQSPPPYYIQIQPPMIQQAPIVAGSTDAQNQQQIQIEIPQPSAKMPAEQMMNQQQPQYYMQVR